MKKSLSLFIFLISILSSLLSYPVKAVENLCCKGRCTGSSYCSACSNCSRCAHCSSGGTCGVCSRRSSGTSYTPTQNHKKAYTPGTQSQTSASSKDTNTTLTKGILVVNKDMINIRKQAALNSTILEKAPKNTKLVKLQVLSSWYKVKVEKTGTIGYVYIKDLK